MGLLDAATNAASTVGNVLSSSGPASALSSLSNAVSGALSTLNGFFKLLPGTNLPLKNPLSAFATYNYVIGIGVLTDNDLNNPDSTYRAGKAVPLLCKSFGADPNNRISTPYGKFDFYVDNLVLNSTIGNEFGNNTNVTTFTFDIIEPFSMGMFMISMQVAAQQAGHNNFREAPYILTIDFRGNSETGQMIKVPGSSRQIPFQVTKFNMKTSDKGTVYNFEAMAYNQAALTTKNANLKSDASVKGKTVQEVLQTGEKSLQSVINKRLQQFKKDGIVEVPDEVLILFPNDISSASSPAGGSTDATETKTSATASTKTEPGSDIFKKLGVTRSSINQTLVQPDGQCNALGASSMGFDLSRKGDAPISKDNQVYDPQKKVYVRAENNSNISESNFKFSQDTDIPTAINQVLLSSNYPNEALDVSKLDSSGMRDWWRIDVNTYNISSDGNAKSTGKKPKLIVYRVVPYKIHSSSGPMPPNVKAPGFEELMKQAVKQYDYLYTGKNTEILRFDIEFNASVDTLMSADGLKRSQDVKTEKQTGGALENTAVEKPLDNGSAPSTKLGVIPTSVSYSSTITMLDKRGGGGAEDQGTRAARLFHDAVTNSANASMLLLNMEILGDPYYIVQSGTGNYTALPTQYTNLNSDGSINYQNGEVDIIVNFRTPVDINQTTGLYTFAGGKSAPVIAFSGLYKVNKVTSHFKQGRFTQVLEGNRRQQQENDKTGTPDQTFNSTNAKPDPTDPTGYGDG